MMSSLAAPIVWSLPWVLGPAAAIARARASKSLDDEPVELPPSPPLVSVIVPARNERRNIVRCVVSVLAAAYSTFEVIVVDDHSSDGTGDLARGIARTDRRLHVIDAPELPAGWFGKQWACATGARHARGELLLFTDADTHHAPDLLPRAVNAMRRHGAELLTLAGHQEMESFWERVVQPQMFGLLALRYGGTEHVSTTPRPANVIANGQFILVRRHSYDAIGGHGVVRHRVAEDLTLAQEYVRAGKRITLLLAVDQLSTRMYASLGELVAGWRKNIYAGGRHTAPGGSVGRALYPVVLLVMPLIGLAPVVVLVLALSGALSAAWLIWSLIGVVTALLCWTAIYAFMRAPLWYALLYPLGLVLVLYIAVTAVWRGNRVGWKGREYLAR